MEKINLKVTLRGEENLKQEREKGMIPAVLYGQKKENKSLWLEELAFGKVFEKAGENTVVVLDLEGGAKDNVLICDYQIDPLSGKFRHVDFLRINMKEDVETNVPLVFVGEAPAVKEKGGILIKVLDEVEVKCLPGNIPQEFEVDLTKLVNFEDVIAISDLAIPEGVEILDDPETVIASVSEPRSEEELAELNEKVEEDVSKVSEVKEKTEEESAPENK
ncbi:MAG: 50S ribosomal protein L25 [Candidatus Moranbacteria bacterium]|jgi:large subunit ribosomal protein L25|nr:50S ribosomal protein L25 [Candidatus Moranbacteria bacterium]NCA93911.1 50S ribosomal protein L25 [Sphingobacteriia bacterium]